MIRVMINSGLGNQMFQYAFAMGLAAKRKGVICDIGLISDRKIHHGEQLQNIFEGIQVKNSRFFAVVTRVLYYFLYSMNSKLVRHIINFLSWDLIMEEKSLIYSKAKNQIILGYWQSSKFFPDATFNYSFNERLLSEKTKRVRNQLNEKSNNTIAIHIRRGDYLNFQSIYGGICTNDYYIKAISYLCSKIETPQLFVFSDDLNWVKENLKILNQYEVSFIDFNQGDDSWQDMYLMSLCSHNIIANSTFSWWGAWLNTNPEKIVICPDRLTQRGDSPDIFPDEWVKMSGC